MQAELEELRLQIKKMKEKENMEMKKLKEVILRQEGTINALTCAKGEEIGGGGAVSNPTIRSKSPSGGHARPLRAQELRNGSSKQNTLQQKSKSKAPLGRKSTIVHDSPKNTQSEEPVDYPPPALEQVNEKMSASTEEEEEEPTEHWLQRHLSKLTVANNNLGAKLTDGRHIHDSTFVRGENHHNDANNEVDPLYDKQQRKPYNAADYGGKSHDHFPIQSYSGTINHHSNPTVPSFVTSAAAHPSHHVATSSEEEVGLQSSKSRIITYKNGTQKEVSPDGTMTISFPNGDRKRTYANEKKGVIVYYYASTKVRCKVCCMAN
jgi:hypothetical protein